MDYLELFIPAQSSTISEIYMAQLSDFPFDSFEQEELYLKAYIRESLMEQHKSQIEEYLHTIGVQWSITKIATVNWNSQWESNFEPVDVQGKCLIRAPFHNPCAEGQTEVVIMPKMSFGTGHHATTYLMTSRIMEHNFSQLQGLDMGSGTGVLAIVAVKLGAQHVDAVDIDEWAAENCTENIATNGVDGRITPILGDALSIEGRSYDFIMANINRNILLADMQKYYETLKKGGFIIMSGILEGDISIITECATHLGLTHSATQTKDGWAAVEFVK